LLIGEIGNLKWFGLVSVNVSMAEAAAVTDWHLGLLQRVRNIVPNYVSYRASYIVKQWQPESYMKCFMKNLPVHSGTELGKNGTKIKTSLFVTKTFDIKCS
jgi:hypothetical protein